MENRLTDFKGSLLTELPWEAGMRLELELLYNSHATSWLFYLFLPLLHNKYRERNCHWVSSWRNQAPLLPPKTNRCLDLFSSCWIFMGKSTGKFQRNVKECSAAASHFCEISNFFQDILWILGDISESSTLPYIYFITIFKV